MLSTASFISMFGRSIYLEIDLINDHSHKYLAHKEKFPVSSPEFKPLVRALQKIETLDLYSREMVLCGPQKSVRTLLRRIRQKEATHESVTGMDRLELSWQVSESSAQDVDPRYLHSHLH